MPWTSFMDMHSGGRCKEEPYEHIYIEAPQDEARVIFYNRFGHSPERVTCTCCGEDYSVTTDESFATLTGYERGCDFGYVLDDGREVGEDEWRAASLEERRAKFAGRERYFERPSNRGYSKSYQTVEQFSSRHDVLVIPASAIKPEERKGDVPVQGYVWQ